MNREAIKKTVKKLAGMARLAYTLGVFAGTLASALIAGLGILVTLTCGVCYLNGGLEFGLRQWFFAMSCVVIGGFSLIMFYLLRRQDGMDDDFLKMQWREVFAFSTLLCSAFFAWIFGMGAIGYFSTELVTAGANATLVMTTQIAALVVLGVVVKKTCSFRQQETH